MGNILGDGLPGAAEHVAADLLPLVNRLARCGARVEEALAHLRDIQMLEWQSPAGRAYRDTVGRQGAALRRAVDALEVARAAVARHAEDTMAAAASACRVP